LFLPFFLLFSLLSFFLYDDNGNNQRLGTNHKLRAESGGKRGQVENAGSGGKRRVWWKTQGMVENAGSGEKRGV